MTTIGPKDFRLTIKYELKNFTQTLSHGMHEMGHGLYEQGRLKNKIGSALTRYDSFGIHESQARFFENIVGRSKPFLNNVAEILLKSRSQKYSKYNKESLVSALFHELNRVNNNIIRIHADEVSYNQHVIIRYILEQKIVAGELRAKDLPEAWNSLYQEYLRISPRNEREGVLQDVHWFTGLVGYFPTYLVGNVYDGIILEEIQKDIPDFWQLISEGNFQSINNWLFEKIYKFGRRFSSVELIENINGKKISSEAFLRYLNNKYLS